MVSAGIFSCERGAAAAVSLGLAGRAVARPVRGSPRIAIVGAGLAGLVCADTLLRRYGLSATVYEAHATRIGGRCFSLPGLVAGKVAENGGGTSTLAQDDARLRERIQLGA